MELAVVAEVKNYDTGWRCEGHVGHLQANAVMMS